MSFWSRIERRIGALAGDLLADENRIELERARELLDGDPESALEILEGLAEKRPDWVVALALLGGARFELGNVPGAIAAFDLALAQEDDFSEALLGRAQCELVSGNLAEAIDFYHRAVSAAGGDRGVLANAYRGLGIAHRRTGDVDKAVRELRKAVTEDAEDPLARAHLGDALLEWGQGSLEEARRHLKRALDCAAPAAIAYVALGRLALAEDDEAAAKQSFELAIERARSADPWDNGDEGVSAMIGLGDAAFERGDRDGASAHFARALAVDPHRADVLARVGAVEVARGRLKEALDAYCRSIEIHSEPTVLARALNTAIEADDRVRGTELANKVLASSPNHSRALVARGLALAADGNIEAAEATYRAALAEGDDAEAHLALAALEIGRENPTQAALEALAALRLAPAENRGRQLLATSRKQELTRIRSGAARAAALPQHLEHADDATLYRLIGELGGLLGARPELAPLVGDTINVAADFDRPLLVTVMGEFSSGKSSFVNAFIGYDVAPTGITPTTATINVVKYGRDRGGRIVSRDGQVESLGWDELFERLRSLSDSDARAIAQIEIHLPLDELERVNIVDTPGLNSILPEHEEVARGFIDRADAVVWLFSAGQAGKKTERAALREIRAAGRRILGVLNKVDQLRPAEVEEVVAHVTGELGDLVELVVPVSAKAAIEANESGSETDPQWGVLLAALETRFFARARELKRSACNRRIGALVGAATGALDGSRSQLGTAADSLRELAETARRDRNRFIEHVVTAERSTLALAVTDVYRQAAREILELVRPRRLPFGSHSASMADRDYLVSLLETGYDRVLKEAEERVVAELESIGLRAQIGMAPWPAEVGGDPMGDIERTVEAAIRLVQATVFDRSAAYVRGYIRGGYVDTFFRRDLAKLELSEDSVYHALYRDSPALDEHLAVPLATAGVHAIDAIADRLDHLADVAELHVFDLESGIISAIDGFELDWRSVTSR